MHTRTVLHLAARAALGAALVLGGSIYPPTGSCTASPAAVTAGGTIEFACDSGSFAADETVAITVTGENGAAATIGMVRTAITTASGEARSDADGALPAVTITLPSDATGTYNIAAVSSSSAGSTAAVTIRAADGSLSSTGIDSGALTALIIGGGGLVVLGAEIAIVAAVRKNRAD